MLDAGDRLAEIEARGTVRDVGVIAEHYGIPDHTANAVRALEGVLSRARARDLVWLEANARPDLISNYYHGGNWRGLEPSVVARLPGAAQRLATFHENGRVREAAVEALAAGAGSDALLYLLLRANDWVVQVADRARAALEQRLRPADATAWIAALPLERHVRALRRRALASLFDRARVLLAEPEARLAIREALVSGSVDVRRACAAFVAELPPEERAPILLLAARDRDPMVAATAARALLEGDADEDVRSVSSEMLTSRVAQVRALALTALWARSASEAFDRGRDALFDSARCVREVAQFELRRRRSVEPAPLYAAALPAARGRRLLATVAGLGECGDARSATAVAPFLSDPAPRLRAEALRAVARLDGDTYASELADALQSASMRVVRTAREALRKRVHLVDRAKLDALLAGGGAGARAVLTLFPQVDYWDALLASLRSAAVPELRPIALRVMQRLLARQSYSLPSNPEALQAALAAVRHDLPLSRQVEELLAGARLGR